MIRVAEETAARLPVVVVDVDGTLIDGQSYSSLLAELWIQKWRRSGLVWVLARRLPFQLLRRLHLVNRLKNQELWAKALAWLFAGATVLEVQSLMSAASHRLEPRIRRSLIAELDEHRRHGRCVFLASTAVEPLLAELARLAGADEYVGTRLAIKDGRYTGELEGPPCNGVRKLECVESVIAEKGKRIEWTDSYAYSDGLPDLPMLERVGNPVLVDPDPELAAIAAGRSWRVFI